MQSQNKKYNLGVIFILVLVLVPVGLWFASRLDSIREFHNTMSLLQYTGQILGIVGFMLFAINIILSARMHWLENIFYGLNKVYEHHARIGKAAFYLMLFHPFTLFFGYFGFTTKGLLNFVTPSLTTDPINWGIYALYLLIVLLVLTIYFAKKKLVKYHIWKRTHKFMGVVFFLGALHAFLMPSDVANFTPLKYYMLAIFVLSASAYLYHSVLGKFLVKKYKYVVSNVEVLGGAVTAVSLSPIGQKMNFTPGQFAFISFVDDTVTKESHPFSLTSATLDETISFNMRNLGDYTSTLPKLAVGSKALIEGPFGKFSYKDCEFKNQIWIAGGIGITPFPSMIQSVKNEPEYSVDLYYCLRNEAEAVHLSELRSCANNRIRIIEHYSDTQGFINAGIIQKESNGFEGKEIFLCAPPAMIDIMRKGIRALGVKNKNIHSEEFKLF